jgi:hypothetical protein
MSTLPCYVGNFVSTAVVNERSRHNLDQHHRVKETAK